MTIEDKRALYWRIFGALQEMPQPRRRAFLRALEMAGFRLRL